MGIGWERRPGWLSGVWLKPLQCWSCYHLRCANNQKGLSDTGQVICLLRSPQWTRSLRGLTVWGRSRPLGILFEVLPVDTTVLSSPILSLLFLLQPSLTEWWFPNLHNGWLFKVFPFLEALPPLVCLRKDYLNPSMINLEFQLSSEAFSDISWQNNERENWCTLGFFAFVFKPHTFLWLMI